MIPSWARNYIGIPYLNLGRNRAGCDCWGLVRLVYEEQFGIHLPSYPEYQDSSERRLVSDLISKGISASWRACKRKENSVVCFKIASTVFHVGIVLDDQEFLHCFSGRDSVIESLSNFAWSKRIEGYYEFIQC